ncbi:MAG: DegT/DnrJ/EryC1/StrS family aminotransferase, partial [Pseudomonadota bacterium]
MHVPLLDLKPQYQAIKKELLASLHDLFETQQFILGPNVIKLEEEVARYCGAPNAVGVTSGTDALLLSLMALDIQPGDRVLTTPYTFFATAGSICRLGAVPLFVDIEPDTYTINPQKMGELLASFSQEEKSRIKAVIPVHLYGQCADMEPILQLAEKNTFAVIEDAAQALGATCTISDKVIKAGALGAFGCLSFFPSKNLGCFGDGGMITAQTEAMACKLKSLRVHGQTEGYYHSYIGINGRLDALQAQVLLIKLPHLDAWAARRQHNAAYYEKLFKEAGLVEHVVLPATRSGANHVFNQFVIRAQQRDNVKAHLEKNDVGCAVYYPLPLHLQECFRYLGYTEGDFPESEKASKETLALPIFPELTH